MRSDDSQKIKQGDEQYKKGMSALSTGLFKWNKDYASAAMYFEEATKIYKAGKIYDKAILALEKLVEVNTKLNDNWAVARTCEQIVNIMIENAEKPNFDKIIDCAKAAGIHFRAADSASNSLQLYNKVARYFEKLKEFDFAKKLLKEALDEANESNVLHMKGDIVNSLLQVLVEAQSFNEAIDVLRGEIDKNKVDPGKTPVMSQILACMALYIITAETINAENFLSKCISEVTGFLKSREMEACDKLLDFYNEGKQEEFDVFVTKPAISSIFPLNIIRNLKKVKVRFGGASKVRDVIDLDQPVDEDEDRKNQELRQQELNKLLL